MKWENEEPELWCNERDRSSLETPSPWEPTKDCRLILQWKHLPTSPPERSAGQPPALPKPCPVGGLQWCESLNGVSIRQKADKVWEAWLDSRLSVTQQYRGRKSTRCYFKTWSEVRPWKRESLEVLTICKARSWSMPRGWLAKHSLRARISCTAGWVPRCILGEVRDGQMLGRSWLALSPGSVHTASNKTLGLQEGSPEEYLGTQLCHVPLECCIRNERDSFF